VVVMYAGKIVEQAPAKRLFGAGGTVKMRYTRALLDAIPHLERPAHTALPVVGGRPPDPTALPLGCSFAPRCPAAEGDCTATEPALTEHAAGHRWACYHPCENGVSA
jgi:oligopeptide/dipeptide ABC transporter ATP-binding protein